MDSGELIAALITAAFAAGIGVTFLVADRDSPTSRALSLFLSVMGLILLLSGLRRARLIPGPPSLLEPMAGLLEAVGLIAGVEWVRRVGRTSTSAGSVRGEAMLRVGQSGGALHALLAIVLPGVRARYAHGDWGAATFGEPGFYLFLAPLLVALVAGGIGLVAIVRSDIDVAERLRLRAFGFAGPFFLSGVPLTPPLEYLPMALGEIIFLSGSVRYLSLQGRRGQFLERFLSPQVARLVRERGLASAMQQSRVQLSVVACDLRGFTAFAETAAPEDVIGFLTEYYDAVGRAVTECGGTIKDFAGDGVLTLIGAPIPYADHASRAVGLALRFRTTGGEVIARWRRLGLELGMGIGVASGFVTVGTISGAERLEYAAIGPAVNLAARLCDRAAPGEILVDQRTVGLIGDDGAFCFESLDPVELKGFSRPVAVCMLAG